MWPAIMFMEGKVEKTCKTCGAVNIVPFKDFPKYAEKIPSSVKCAGCGQNIHNSKGTWKFETASLKIERALGNDKAPSP